MNIAVLSDTHDHIWNLEKVLKQIKGKVKAVIFCGDMCAPFTAGVLAKTNLHTYLCLGNVDEDHIMMAEKGGDKFVWIGLAKEFGQVELGGRKTAFCHYPKLAELLAKSGEYDAVFHGHTHFARNEKYGKTILVNPGAVCGIQKGIPGKASYAIYDTKTNSAEIIEIK
jgi:hypothetical protein